MWGPVTLDAYEVKVQEAERALERDIAEIIARPNAKAEAYLLVARKVIRRVRDHKSPKREQDGQISGSAWSSL